MHGETTSVAADRGEWEPTFETPGKGTWEMDATHCPKPLAPLLQEVFADGLSAGMRRSCARYGLLLDTLVVRYVQGFPYIQPKPVGAPEGATGTPPRFLVKLMLWLHPALRARLRTAERVFIDRPWREELADWDARVKPATVARHRALAAAPLTELDDSQLADTLEPLVSFAREMVEQDHSYNCTYMVPLGDYLAQVGRFTGADGAELMALLRGHSDASTGDLVERRRVSEALANDAEARAVLESDRSPAEIVAALEARPGPFGEALADYLLFAGGAALGISLTSPCFREQPELVVPALRAATSPPKPRESGLAEAERRLRERVPASHRDTFDELLAEARLVYRLRDERHTYGAIPLVWHARRTLLEVGRRLEERGELPDRRLALFAFSHELESAVRGRSVPDVALWERRRRDHDRLDGWSVPARFGPEGERPPSDVLPSAARRLSDALDAYMLHTNEAPAPAPSRERLSGLGVSPGTWEGTARICSTQEDLIRIQQGDVLVAQTTTVAINGALPLLGAIVTDRGGALCHAAIVCREFGIPGVVGTGQATKRITDGARLRVDGTAGTVEVLR